MYKINIYGAPYITLYGLITTVYCTRDNGCYLLGRVFTYIQEDFPWCSLTSSHLITEIKQY